MHDKIESKYIYPPIWKLKHFTTKKLQRGKKLKCVPTILVTIFMKNIIGIDKQIYIDIYFYGTNFIFIFKFMLRTGPIKKKPFFETLRYDQEVSRNK